MTAASITYTPIIKMKKAGLKDGAALPDGHKKLPKLLAPIELNPPKPPVLIGALVETFKACEEQLFAKLVETTCCNEATTPITTGAM